MTELLWQLSACDIVRGIHNKTFSCEEVMQSVVQRIAERNGSINAIVYDYSDEAIVQAQEADRALSSGSVVGPLHGVPVTIKSNIDVKGQPTPNGVPTVSYTHLTLPTIYSV